MGDFKQKFASQIVGRLTGEKVTAKPSEPPTKKEKKAAEQAAPGQDDVIKTEDVERTGVTENTPLTDAPDNPEPGEPDADEDEAYLKAEKKKKRMKLLVIGGVILVAALAVFFIFQSIAGGAKATINLLEAVSITADDNVSGYGTISLSVDEQRLAQLISESGAFVPQDETPEGLAKKIAGAVLLEASKTENIANGDEIAISVSLPEDRIGDFPGMNLKAGQGKWTASDMPEGKLIAPFDSASINVRVEGNSGAAKAYLDILAKGSYVYYLNYDWSPKTGLKNGDTVVVTITPMESKLTELGYVLPKEREWEYIVGGLNELVDNASEIPDTFLNSMVSYAEAELAKDFASVPITEGQDIVVTEPEITSIYFLDKADKSTPYSDWFNGLQMTNGVAVLGHFFVQDVEPVKTENEDGTETVNDEVVQTYGGYYVWIFPDMVRRTGGDYGYNQGMITKRTTSYQTENDCLSWMKGEFSGFAVTKIGSNPAA